MLPIKYQFKDCLGDGTPFPKQRLIKRRVNEESVVRKTCINSLLEPDQLHYKVDHGGSVANAYKYFAETETLGVVAQNGVACAFMSRVPAKSVTYSVAANSTIGGGKLWHTREYKPETVDQARKEISDKFYEAALQNYHTSRIEITDKALLAMFTGDCDFKDIVVKLRADYNFYVEDESLRSKADLLNYLIRKVA